MGKVKQISQSKGLELKKKGYRESMSLRVAKENSGRKNIYRVPVGVYLWKK